MSEQLSKQAAFKLKGRLYTLTVMQLLHTDLQRFESQLKETIAQAPKLFEQMPVVLDCSSLSEETFPLAQWCQCLKTHGVIPVAVQGGHAWLTTLAQCEGLAVLAASLVPTNTSMQQDKERAVDAPVVSAADELISASPVSSVKSVPTKIHDTPVRSGQQIVAKDGDLVVLSSVSPGAELLAAGNIYVYGALRGRALAGMTGLTSARIFCQSLDAELIAVAGVYRLNESLETMPKPTQIFLQDERIVIEPISSCFGL